MGTFRSVYVELPCERCGAVRREEVQFKTGADRQQVYEAGDRVREDDGLRRGERYAGAADRYCAACVGDWLGAEARALHEVLARYVEEGGLTVLDRTGEAITADEWRRRGPEYATRLSADDVRHRRSVLHHILAGCQVFWEGKDVRTFRSAGLGIIPALNERVDVVLRDAGWVHGWDWLREDLVVAMDDDRRLRVDVAPLHSR